MFYLRNIIFSFLFFTQHFYSSCVFVQPQWGENGTGRAVVDRYVKFSFQVCTKRYWLLKSPVKLTLVAGNRFVCGHWTELRGSLYSIRHLMGFATMEQNQMLMPNCWKRKDRHHLDRVRGLLLLLLLRCAGCFSLGRFQSYTSFESLWLKPVCNSALVYSCVRCNFNFLNCSSTSITSRSISIGNRETTQLTDYWVK